MKLHSLYVSNYKNIKKQRFEFNSNLISLLVGRNGLGKSNLIEILALIFRDLEQLQKQADFEEWAYSNFEYELHYECKNSELKIACKPGKFKVRRRQKGTKTRYKIKSFSAFQVSKKEEYLPKYIIGYYSGENKRIRDIIRPYEIEDWKNLKKNDNSDNGFRSLFFAEPHHSLAVMLTILLYRVHPPSKEFENRLDRLIKEFTTFSRLESFRIRLQNPSWYKRTRNTPGKFSIEEIEANLLAKEPVEFPFWGIKGKAHRMISFLYNHNHGDPIYYYEEETSGDKKVKEGLGREFLELKLDKDKVASQVYNEFGHPANFLDALDTLYTIESIAEIELEVASKNRNAFFEFNALSEGEQQIVTVLGLILLMGREDCLFLLDEPDTHLNPRWQRQYVELLKAFNLNDENSHIIVATHSPLLVQAVEDADIFMFRQKQNGKVEVVNEDFKIRNWRIDQVLVSEYFDFEHTRPRELDELMEKRSEIIAKGILTDADRDELKRYENSIGYLPTGETIDDIDSMVFINKMAKQLEDDQNR